MEYGSGHFPESAHAGNSGVIRCSSAPCRLVSPKAETGQSCPFPEHQIPDGFLGTISVRQALSSMGAHAQKYYEGRLQAHRQIYLTAMHNRELALQNRDL